MNAIFDSYGASVIGSTHLKKELPNQDAFRYENLDNGIQILAVSDGHGGAMHCHSDRGAKIAVEVAIDVCKGYFCSDETLRPNDVVQFDFEEKLSMEIQSSWLSRVSDEADFEDKIQFGCTLLVAIRTETQLIFLQLGDGKIAIVYEDGVVYFPMSRDAYAATHYTNSLSQDHAWLMMKVFSMHLEESIHMVILATDGVENAYPYDFYDDANFYLNLAKTDNVDQRLKDMLQGAEYFSKDDCTVALWKNATNVMVDRIDEMNGSDEIVIWAGENQLPYKSLSELSDITINKKIEIAILMIDAFRRNAWRVPKYMTLKKMYYDDGNSIVDWFVTSENVKLTDIRLKEWILQWIGISIHDIRCDNSRGKLLDLQRKIRYDYEKHTFYFTEDLSDYKLMLVTSTGHFEVFHNSELYLHQMMALSGDINHLVGSVTQHEKYPQIWGLINKTQHTWQVFGSAQTEISPGKILTLKHGLTFYAFGLPVKIFIQ